MPCNNNSSDYPEIFDKALVMVKRLLQFTPVLIFGILLAGCPNQPDPSPEDTAFSGGMGNRGDFVQNPGGLFPSNDVLSDANQGLFPRDEGFIDGRQEGILPSVFFDYDQSFVREDQRTNLMEAFDYLEQNPDYRLLVEAHCDYKGTAEYNIALGDRRGSSVKTFLTQLGISENRIEVLSKGDLEAMEGGDDLQRQQDRRADMVVVQ